MAIPIFVVGLLAAACATAPADRLTQEKDLELRINEMLPGGRIYPNDLSAGKDGYVVDQAWLFDDQILVQDATHAVTSLARSNLEAKWYYARLKDRIDHDPGMGPVSVVMIANDVLHEVERGFGNQLHVYELDFLASGGAGVTDSTAYIPARASAAGINTLYTINLANGLKGWGLSTRDSILHAPIVGGAALRPMLYFTSEDRGVYCYPAAPATAGAPEPTWLTETLGDNLAPMSVSRSPAGDLVLVGSTAGDLWAWDRVTGERVWVLQSGSPITERPRSSGDQVYMRNEEGFFALARDDGAVLWRADQADFVVRRSDAVYVTPAPGVLKALDPRTGEVLRTAQFEKTTRFLVNETDGVLFLITKNGFVFAVDEPLR